MKSPNDVYIIAEAGVNHNGDLNNAFELIDVAEASGADAVKFQLFKADKLVRKSAPMADYQKTNVDVKKSQYQLLTELELSHKDFRKISDYCTNKNIDLLITPFDEDSATFLIADLQLTQIKLSSGDLNNAPLLLFIAKLGADVILSTGMATLTEIEQALGVLAFGYFSQHAAPSMQNFATALQNHQTELANKVTVLHCTSEYPAPCDSINLFVMQSLRKQFGLNTGLSDHSDGIHIPIAATALGAKVIEKHFTLNKKMPGPDHLASLEPSELAQMVRSIREVTLALGDGQKNPMPCELSNRKLVRKSVVANNKIKSGEIFTENNLTVMRPADGIEPIQLWELLGQVSGRDYEAGELIKR